MADLRKKINNIPGDGGWVRPSSEQRFIKLAEGLLEKGLSENEALEVLARAYCAAEENCTFRLQDTLRSIAYLPGDSINAQ